eukprot:TRINITY_DN75053_c0_g1_i1.p1 TRINITY_DN75053_c0_g1~~TRINITY_DN75053_c0_g1_i1.p1  ORF type:complete len:577 (-),score=86.53 TRINITY_DN75053_c0_g1_i1:172-1902(-)
MDVDRDNFEDALVLFEKHLPQATFVSIDLEMTGISGPPATKSSGGDTPTETYAKGRSIVEQPYSIIQVGICLFEENLNTPGKFDCRPFNVYVFPRPVNERDSDGKQIKTQPFIGVSTSSMTFLASNGMDFNRWIAKGVNFTDSLTRKALEQAMPKPNKTETSTENGAFGGGGPGAREKAVPTKQADIKFVKETMARIAEFVERKEEAFRLPQTNAFLALVLRQNIDERYPHLVVEKRGNPDNPRFQERWVLNLSEEGRLARDQEIRKHFLSQIGFGRMWHTLKDSQKPLVLHNAFFDLLFLVSAFEGSLPATLPEFKNVVHQISPCIIDTKIIAESKELSGRLSSRSGLGDLAAGLAQKLAGKGVAASGEAPADMTDTASTTADIVNVSFSLPDGFQSYLSSEGSFHTAGYDAYETGRIFAYYRSAVSSSGIKQFEDRIFLMFSAFEIKLRDEANQINVGGAARYLYDLDVTLRDGRKLQEVLKPIVLEGKTRVTFRWCDDGQSVLLVMQGVGFDDGDPARASHEKALDGLLAKEEKCGRLKVSTWEDYIAGKKAPFAATEETSSTEPLPKRQRTD